MAGFILNRRNVPDEENRVKEHAKSAGTSVISDIPRSDFINLAEDMGKTVIEAFPDSDIAGKFRELAETILVKFGEHGNLIERPEDQS